MNVNPNIYGNKSQWVQPYANIEVYCPDFPVIAGDNENNSGYWHTTLPCAVYYDLMNTTDEKINNSISPWKVNRKSTIFNPKILSKNSIGQIELIPVFSGDNDLFLFRNDNTKPLNIGNFSTGYEYSPYNFDAHFKWGVSESDYFNANGAIIESGSGYLRDYVQLSPICDFNYRHILIMCKIKAGYINVYGSFTSEIFSVEDYYNYGYEDYPYILGYYPIMYLYNSDLGYYHNFGENISIINGGKVKAENITISNNYDNVKQLDGYHVYNTSVSYTNDISMYTTFNIYSENNNLSQYICFAQIDNRFEIQTSITSNQYTTYIHHDNITKMEILKEFAYLGFWFTPQYQGLNDANAGKFGESEYLYLPEFDSTNTTTGKYQNGENVKKLPNFDYTNISDVATSEEDRGDLTTQIYGMPLNGVKNYWLSWEQFNILKDFLNSASLENVDFFGKNPADYISNITGYLFRPTPTTTGNLSNVIIRGIDTGAEGFVITTESGLHYTFTTNITPFYGDFRDYSPYTKIELYTILGSVELDSELFMNHTLNVEIYPDILTGHWNILIKRDSLLVDYISGKYGANISLLAEQAGTYQNTIVALENQKNLQQLNYNQSFLGSFTKGLTGIFNGDFSSVFNSVSDTTFNTLKQNEYNSQINYTLSHTPPQLKNIGSNGNYNNLTLPFRPKIIITRPKMLEYDSEIYAHNIGHACNVTGIVKDFTGYTQCANINCDNISATPQEINMIKSICCNGFYI